MWINSLQEQDCVRPDDEEAGYRATKHLAGLGHERIAYVDYVHSWDPNTEVHYSAQHRCLGYERAMRELNLRPRIIHGDPGPLAADAKADFSRIWLSTTDRPTAVVTYGTEVQPIYIAALKLGLDVPRDLSLITFGANQVNPAHVPCGIMLEPLQYIGASAVQLLFEKIEDPSHAFPAKALPFDLVTGTLSGPAID